MAINRADGLQDYVLEGNTRSGSTCVFISHKKEDEAAALAIGNYIKNYADVDIYLDLYDLELVEAVSTENDRKIVASIKRGLRTSTHLLCLISDKTRLSWWVPYEIGVASELKKDITSLKLKNISDMPSFLKTEKVLMNASDFEGYVNSLKPVYALTEHTAYTDLVGLKKYLD